MKATVYIKSRAWIHSIHLHFDSPVELLGKSGCPELLAGCVAKPDPGALTLSHGSSSECTRAAYQLLHQIAPVRACLPALSHLSPGRWLGQTGLICCIKRGKVAFQVVLYYSYDSLQSQNNFCQVLYQLTSLLA